MRGYFFAYFLEIDMALRTPLTAQPHLYIGDSTGRPLDYGRVYFGEPNKDPEFYPIDIYLDPEMTIAAAQPVRTKGGFMDVGGNLAELHAAEVIYSLKVLDQYGRQVFYKPEMYRNNVSDFLVDEITRATAAENLISGNLTAETQRAIAAESDLNANIIKEVSDRKSDVTRLDEADAVLQAQINSVGGGKLAYKTYAEMIADKSNIAAKSSIDILADTDDKNGTYLYDGANFVKSKYDLEKLIRAKVQNTFDTYTQMVTSDLSNGAYALVADDNDKNNGIYIKRDDSWVKSKYDPYTAAITEMGQKINTSNGGDIIQLLDSSGKSVSKIDYKGDLYIAGLDDSVQKSIKDLKVKDSDMISKDSSSDIWRLLDSNANPIIRIDQSGVAKLLGNKIITEKDMFNNPLVNNFFSVPDLMMRTDKLAQSGQTRLLRDEQVVDAANTNSIQTMTPSMTRINDNTYYLVTTDGGAGDFALAAIYGYTITIDKANNYALSISSPNLIVQDGTDAEGAWAAAGGSVLYVHEGKHAGRLYTYYIKRYGEVKDVLMMTYSDNMGENWTTPESLERFYPQDGNYRVLVPSPAELIQVTRGKYKGRLLIPAWRGDTTYPKSQASLKSLIIYSDDGGETYHIGAESQVGGSNESAIAHVNDDVFAHITRDWSNYKWIEYSYDGGMTFVDKRRIDEIRTQKVQSGFIQAENQFDSSMSKLILTGPHGAPNWNQDKDFRDLQDLGLHISYDGGKSFPVHKIIAKGIVRYSAIGIIDEHTIFVVYVAGEPKSKMNAVTINLKEIFLGE